MYIESVMGQSFMKYKVGDKVKVKKDLRPTETYGVSVFTDKMQEFLGKEVEIARIEPYFPSIDVDSGYLLCSEHVVYRLKEDNGKAHWSIEMFEDKIMEKIVKWQEYGVTVIHCKSEVEAVKLLTTLNSYDFKYSDGRQIGYTYHKVYKENTCYAVDLDNKTVSFADLRYYLDVNCAIRPFSKLYGY